ncbi:MAG: hypothetical protein RIQ68_2297, partial [Pseudomonadota bacterium]
MESKDRARIGACGLMRDAEMLAAETGDLC